MQYVNAQNTQVPALGFGTFELEPEIARKMVAHALDTGYRHIDTAQMYENEEAVGGAITASGVDRSDIFLTTKVWMDNYADGDLQKSVKTSLDKLETDYVDLLLLHWPNPDVDLEETLGALADAKKRGMARNIGISNFPTDWMKRALPHVKLLTNQVEYHPYLDQSAVLQAARGAHMAVTAYCPLAQGKVFDDPTLKQIGEKHGKNGGQVTLRWLLQQDVIAIPRSSKPEHVDSNLEVFDFELSDDEMQQIHGLSKPNGRVIDPGFAPEWD